MLGFLEGKTYDSKLTSGTPHDHTQLGPPAYRSAAPQNNILDGQSRIHSYDDSATHLLVILLIFYDP